MGVLILMNNKFAEFKNFRLDKRAWVEEEPFSINSRLLRCDFSVISGPPFVIEGVNSFAFFYALLDSFDYIVSFNKCAGIGVDGGDDLIFECRDVANCKVSYKKKKLADIDLHTFANTVLWIREQLSAEASGIFDQHENWEFAFTEHRNSARKQAIISNAF